MSSGSISIPGAAASERDAADGRPLARADLHLHTNLGDGTASPARVLSEAKHRGLKVIAITDHDHMEGAKRVQELIDREGSEIEMIWGCEVTTRQGHFLGLFMKRPVRFLTHVEGAIDAIKEQGGLCVIPHPMGRLVPSLSLKKIEELLNRDYPIDGIELYNPSPANASVRGRVRELNGQWGFAGTGSSDAHFWQHIGAGYTLFPGETAEDLRAAILNRTTRAGGQEQPPERLPLTSYIGQCFWSMVLDPPRKLTRMARGHPAVAPETDRLPARP
ncbi:MAG TPA: PHP domain-containing protein [Ktedonobacterales bacterium]|jgi:predicted metal-dependent phosphoesterase TrpH|nr:PHP domain-containing protein [Ktedonobacterales bacterium]